MNKYTKRVAYLTTAALLTSTLSNMGLPLLATEISSNTDEVISRSNTFSSLTTPSMYEVSMLNTAEPSVTYDFESDLEGWGARGNAKVSQYDTEPHTGTYCLAISDRTQNWHGLQKDVTKLTIPGKTYTFGAWVKYTDGDDKEQFTLSMQLDTTDGAATQYNWICNNDHVQKGEWTYLTGEITLPNNASSAIVYLEANNASLDFYVDDITMSWEESSVSNIEIQKDIPSLKDVYDEYFKFGAAVAPQNLNELEEALVAKHFNSITCENAMKPEAMLDYDATISNGDNTHPQVKLSEEAIKTLDFAKKYNIPVRGHVLVWHSQTPNWFFTENYSKDAKAPVVSKKVMLERMENYINAVFKLLSEKYPEVDFYAFDVVNEAVNPSGPDGLRFPATVATTSGNDNNNENANNSMWMTTIGKEHIEKAFEYARAASKKYLPGVKLAYNDYNECDVQKSEIIYNICKDLYDKGLIDVIGMQAHYDMSSPSATQFENAIRKYASIGENIEIQITELDIGQPNATEEGLLKQAYRYKTFFDTMKKLDKEQGINISSCTVWGVRDNESWRSENSPILFDENYQAKPAFWGITDDSKLPVPTKEITSYGVTNDNVEEALLIQSETDLVTNEGTKLGTFKVVWDENKLYVKVTPDEAFKDGDVKINIFCNSDKLSFSALDNVFEIPLSTSLKDGDSLRFDVGMQVGEKVAAWNNTGYDGSLNVDKANLGKLMIKAAPKMASAVKGTPTIDGTIDEIWEKATPIHIDTFSVGKEGATGVARTLWDEDHIYVLAEVKDKLLSAASNNEYEQDSIEAFIDEDNAKSTSYEKGDGQYRVSFENKRTINGFSDDTGFNSATKTTEDGYLVEFSIPARLAQFKEGQFVGFDLQINDDADGNGTRDNVSNWNDLTGMGWSNTSNYGILKLAPAASTPSESPSDKPGDNTPSTPGGNTPNTPSTPSDSSPSQPSSSSSSSSSGGGGGGSSSTTTPKTPAELVKDSVSKNESPLITLDTTHKLTLNTDTLSLLKESAHTLNIQSDKVTAALSPDFMKTNLSHKDSVELSLAPISAESFTNIGAQVAKQKELTIVGDASQIITVGLKEDTAVTAFTEPLKLTMDLSKVTLPEASKLTLVQYVVNEDKSVSMTKLGGTYDEKAHTFTALVGQPGTYGVMSTDSLHKISLRLDNKVATVNDKEANLSIDPQIMNDRTLVPLRFVSEALDLKVDWASKTKEITLTSLDNQTLKLRINEDLKDYGAPIIRNNYTLVPLRYISEELGAHVLWVPSSKTIEIIK